MESMNIDAIINRHKSLDKELQMALSTMERSDRVVEIRREIIDNQKQCPHVSDKYNWTITNETCPYCGFHFATGGRAY